MTPPEMQQRAVGPLSTPDRSLARDETPAGELALTVNGSALATPQGLTVADLLERLSLDPRTVVVEHNGTILRDRAATTACRLQSNDVLEIVHFVGGG
jgi:sulfur carrier protein